MRKNARKTDEKIYFAQEAASIFDNSSKNNKPLAFA
jgi:hypothetical protein